MITLGYVLSWRVSSTQSPEVTYHVTQRGVLDIQSFDAVRSVWNTGIDILQQEAVRNVSNDYHVPENHLIALIDTMHTQLFNSKDF